jgi:ABC-type branched-subunit amino acid transport system ATPase component
MKLRAENLTKSFNGLRALDGVTVEFDTKEVTAIIGPNGAGKTTLINAITGFGRVDSGRCLVGKKETTTLAPDQIARFGVVRTFQEVRLVWTESVIENVMIGVHSPLEQLFRAATTRRSSIELRRIQQKAIELLRLVGLQDHRDALAKELSYGQQKLLSLARCMAMEARWLVLDEPMSGVSPDLIDVIVNNLQRLASDGAGVVLIEHDIRAVRKVADTVVVLDQGRIVTNGPSSEVLERRDLLEAYLE